MHKILAEATNAAQQLMADAQAKAAEILAVAHSLMGSHLNPSYSSSSSSSVGTSSSSAASRSSILSTGNNEKVPPFNATNYRWWSSQMSDYLDRRGLWYVTHAPLTHSHLRVSPNDTTVDAKSLDELLESSFLSLEAQTRIRVSQVKSFGM